MTSTDWGKLVEEEIEKALERGGFDDLPGKGKPLDLRENPLVPPEWRLAYKILKDHGFAPDWIELDKEIRAELQECRKLLADHARWHNQVVAALRGKSAGEVEEEMAKLAADREWVIGAYRERAAKLNEKIKRFNLIVPVVRLQRRKISLEDEIGRFEESCPRFKLTPNRKVEPDK